MSDLEFTARPDKVIRYYSGDIHDGIVHPGHIVPGDDDTTRGCVVDVETTGLDPSRDKITEIGLINFDFLWSTGQVVQVYEPLDFLQDPGEPLSEEIIALTHLTDEMLKGHAIPWEEVDKQFSQANIIIAHNAKFDRAFIRKKSKVSDSNVWGCSKADVNWKSMGHVCNHLQHLCNDTGFYYDGHRSVIDCASTLKLLSHVEQKPGGDHEYHLHKLITRAMEDEVIIEAAGAPFKAKDILKEKGFNWDTINKFWFKKVTKFEHDGMQRFMEEVYGGRDKSNVVAVDRLRRFL